MLKGTGKRVRLCLLTCGTSLIISSVTFASSANMTHPKANKCITEIRLITPFTAQGLNPKITVTERVKGDCWSTSLTNKSRPNTWRCQAMKKPYDPCFVNPARPGDSVICLKDPWNNKAVEIKLNSPLPSTTSRMFNHKSAQPWALELANGNHCTLMTGPSLLIAGMKTRYQCKSAVLIGKIDRSSKDWMVLYMAHNSMSIREEHIKTAWY